MTLISPAIERYQYFEGMPSCSIVAPRSVADKHLHKEMEMVYLFRGSLDILVQDRVFKFERGGLLCIGENTLHQYGFWDENTLIVKLKFMREWMMPSFMRQAEREAYFRLYNQSFLVRPDPVIKRIIHEMLQYPEGPYLEYFYLSRLIELTARILENQNLIEDVRATDPVGSPYMTAALKYVEDNCFMPITLKMLSDHIGLTECYCSKLFKKTTGISFIQYLNAARINNAQRLLMYSNHNITEISEMCGFSSIQTFNRVFKNQTSRTPREYRMYKRSHISLSDFS